MMGETTDTARRGAVVLRAGSDAGTVEDIVADLQRGLAGKDLAFVLVFVSPEMASPALSRALGTSFGTAQVIGCTTAGEIGPGGYVSGGVRALGFPADLFRLTARRLLALESFTPDEGSGVAHDLLAEAGEAWPHRFVVTLIDGHAMKEDDVLAAITPALIGTPLIGGSAGDGLSFGPAQILHEGAFHSDAALLALIDTVCPVRVFRFDHFTPLDRRMVVTGADPAQRLVTEINAEPAAREYARIVGKDPNQLSPFIFAEHPVVVKIAGEHFVRAIQKVEPNGDLRFYSAIDEGLVLTVAEAGDMAMHLEQALSGLAEERAPGVILGFDCVLRRLEAEQKQQVRQVSTVLDRHGVVGFSTYGEQFGAMHVNQTLTGAAIYPPDGR